MTGNLIYFNILRCFVCDECFDLKSISKRYAIIFKCNNKIDNQATCTTCGIKKKYTDHDIYVEKGAGEIAYILFHDNPEVLIPTPPTFKKI